MPQYEKLPTLYGGEICDKPFRLLGDSWERYKSTFDHREDKVFGKRVDPSKPVSAPGNFQIFDAEKKEYVEARFADYDYYLVQTKSGAEYHGHLLNTALPPWEPGNFVLDTAEGERVVGYDSLDSKPEHVVRIKRVEYVPVSLLTPTKLKDKSVQRVKLECTKTASDALSRITSAVEKADGNPKNFAFTFTYKEEEKQYVIEEAGFRKLTDEEKAQAAADDEAAKTTPLEDLPPPAGMTFAGADEVKIDDLF